MPKINSIGPKLKKAITLEKRFEKITKLANDVFGITKYNETNFNDILVSISIYNCQKYCQCWFLLNVDRDNFKDQEFWFVEKRTLKQCLIALETRLKESKNKRFYFSELYYKILDQTDGQDLPLSMYE